MVKSTTGYCQDLSYGNDINILKKDNKTKVKKIIILEQGIYSATCLIVCPVCEEAFVSTIGIATEKIRCAKCNTLIEGLPQYG